ncbi:hypothetical protein AAG570_010039, partial [Ranatra chinensis]
SNKYRTTSVSAEAVRSTYRRCKFRLVIEFFTLRRKYAAETHGQIVETYGLESMSRHHACKWVRLFKECGADAHDEESNGSAIETTFSDGRVTIDTLYATLSRSSPSLMGEIVLEKRDYRKL